MKFELNGPLQALLWKRYKYRTRKCHILLLEMFSAIIVFAILVMMKQMIINLKKQKEQKGKIIKVIYTPENYMAGAIMNPICSGHILGPEIECFSFNNDKTLQTFLEINNNSVTVLNFTNLKTETYPNQLEYTVQFKPLQEHTQKSTDFLLFHEEVDTPDYLPFLANLQWTINKGYLEKAFGEQVEHTIELKEITQKVSTDTALHAYLTLCSVIAPITFFLFTLSNMDYDKKTGLIAQMQFVGVSYNAVKISYIVDTIVFAMIYSIMITLFLKFMPPPVLLYSNAFLIIITFILHFLTITVLAFLCAAVSQPFQYAESLSLIIYVFLFWINTLLYERAIKEFIGRIFLYLLVPHSVICAFWYDVASLEDKGIGLQVKHLVEQEDTNHLLISLVWLFMFGHIIIGLAIAWYLDKVMPGRFGIALPLTFIFNKKYWFKAKRRRGVNFHVTAEKKTQLQDNRFFEHPPSKKTKVAIKIAKVSKEFKSLGRSPVLALDFVNLDVYKGEITVILGINGAGKTTLLSIITGMYEATKGNVYINGMDVNTRFHDLQKDLAYCPQKSVVFDFLTVRENIMFFQTVRGERANKRSNAQHIIGTLKMSEFADYYSHELSAGMKRCLQVACTLVCDADVIVLDEPTAGMDRQMRHDVWDVLLGLRKEKTILFTTTVLDEADALGDRIALLNQGKIKCHGSPIFLKKAIGADFILTVRLDEEITEGKEAPMKIRDAITAAGVTGEHTSKFMLSKSQASRVCLHLPAGERMLFPKVFDVLEERRRELGIACMDVGVSLEQVFLRFVEEDNIDYISAIQADTEMDDDVERLRGCHLWCQQYRILTMRAFQFVWARRCQFIFLQILIPFFALILITCTTNNAPVTMDDEVTALKGNTLVLYEPVGYRRKDVFNPLLYRFPKVVFSTSEDVRKDISQVLKSKDRQFHTYGYKMNGSRTEIYHHPFASYAGISNAINIFSNMYMSLNMPYALRNHINTTVLQATMLQSSKALTKPKLVMHILSWSMWIAFLAIIPVAPLILLCIEEYYSGTRFNHLLIGCPPSIIWISKLTAHMIIYVAIVPPTVIVAAALMDNDSTINQWDYLIATFVLLTVYGPAFLIHWYVFSFAMNERYPITIIYIVSLYVALIVPTFVRILNKVMQFHKYASDIIIISYVFFNFSPIFTFSIGLGRISFTARNNALCKLNFHLCPNDFKGNEFVTVAKCCNSQDATPFKYFDALETGLLELCLLFVQIGVYWTLLLLLQCRKIQMVREVVMKKVLKQPLKRYEDLNVRDEEIYVHEQMEQIRLMSIEERQTEADTILVDNLCKQYNLIIGKRCLAVNGVSFSVEKGECLGILGRSGAGKTSLLNMVAGFITSTAGRSVVNGYFLHEERRKYLKEICLATSGGVDEFLTGYRNLEIAAALRGYDYGHSEKMAIRYLQYMGLVTYSNVLSRNYSAGCLQRLRVCNTLIGKPHAAFFDEPCSSVDPYARPLVVRAIKKLLLSGCACVITEENAEWKYIDCVWNRMAIIDKGEMVAIGTVPELRQEYGAGYSATIKLKVDSAYGVVETVEDQNESEIDDTVSLHSYKYLVPVNNTNILKEEFLKIFDTSTLMDEHLSMLYFHIQDPGHSLLYSVMFEKLEGLKNKFSIIEDYTLSEVSVSEILSRLEKILHEKQKESSHMMKINMIGSDTPTPTTQSRAGSAASLTSISSRRQNPSPSQPQALSSQPQDPTSSQPQASSSQPQDPTSSQPQASSSQPQDPTSSQPQASSSQPRDPSSQPLDLTSQPRDPSSSSQPPDPSSSQPRDPSSQPLDRTSQPRDPSSSSQPPDSSSSQPRDPSS